MAFTWARQHFRRTLDAICKENTGDHHDVLPRRSLDGAFALCGVLSETVQRASPPFYDASSLAKWEVGGPATTALSTEGKQMHFCRLTDLNAGAGACSVELNGGVVRDGVLLTDLRATPDNPVCLR